jgi:hypothetical protein
MVHSYDHASLLFLQAARSLSLSLRFRVKSDPSFFQGRICCRELLQVGYYFFTGSVVVSHTFSI